MFRTDPNVNSVRAVLPSHLFLETLNSKKVRILFDSSVARRVTFVVRTFQFDQISCQRVHDGRFSTTLRPYNSDDQKIWIFGQKFGHFVDKLLVVDQFFRPVGHILCSRNWLGRQNHVCRRRTFGQNDFRTNTPTCRTFFSSQKLFCDVRRYTSGLGR